MMKKIVATLALLLLMMPITPITAEPLGDTVRAVDLPSFFSWTDINGVDYTTPIRDQTPAPTCEAYGLCASLETIMQYQLDELYGPDLSETHLYFYAGGTYEAGYVNIMDAANYLMEYGVPDEGCYPDPHRAFDYSFESLPGWENRTVKIQDWGWIDHDSDSIKSALMEYGPLVICISFPRDFFYYRQGVYTPRWGRHAGGHVVALVGYDDSNECWICKNSWGTGWGEDGWFRLAYDADIFAEWYGNGTGIMYLDGVYGNLQPDVPKVYLSRPIFLHTYFFGRQLPTIFKKLPLQKSAARIFGNLEIEVATENTDNVEFYIDDVFQGYDDEEPFTCTLQASRGIHTLEVRAANAHNISLDIVDFYVFF